MLAQCNHQYFILICLGSSRSNLTFLLFVLLSSLLLICHIQDFTLYLHINLRQHLSPFHRQVVLNLKHVEPFDQLYHKHIKWLITLNHLLFFLVPFLLILILYLKFVPMLVFHSLWFSPMLVDPYPLLVIWFTMSSLKPTLSFI